jgi:peptidoglycan/xylan/chitin deacetylase (PgdA/CDA1 family)
VSFAVTVSVDVDGEAGLPGGGSGESLTARSERRYGVGRGLERVLAALSEVGAAGTFYVPGATARAHPCAIAAILEHGHELGHHGEAHLRPDAIDEAAQRAEVEQGIASLTEIAGEAPSGYRAPGWAMTETTLDLLAEAQLAWDSSLMEADSPYRVGTLWELPVQWALDDAAWLAHPSDPAGMLAVWTAELAAARREERHVTLTMHPEIIGLAHRIDGLRRLLDGLAGTGTALIPHGRVVDLLGSR